jgi:hypothetical protein
MLTACGGGGDDSKSSVGSNNSGDNTQFSATLELLSSQIPEQLIESETVEFSFTLKGVEGILNPTIEYDYLPENSLIETSISGAEVILTVILSNEVMHNKVSNIKVSIEDQRSTSNQVVSWEGVLPVVNSSGNKEYDRWLLVRDAAQTYALLSEERELIRRLTYLAQLIKAPVSVNEQSQFIERINLITSNEILVKSLDDAINLSYIITQQYINGEIDETRLGEISSLFEPVISEYSYAAYLVIQDVINITDKMVGNYEFQVANLNNSNKYSSFIGNKSLGAYEEEKWIFHNEYAYLESIANPQLDNCDAE